MQIGATGAIGRGGGGGEGEAAIIFAACSGESLGPVGVLGGLLGGLLRFGGGGDDFLTGTGLFLQTIAR